MNSSLLSAEYQLVDMLNVSCVQERQLEESKAAAEAELKERSAEEAREREGRLAEELAQVRPCRIVVKYILCSHLMKRFLFNFSMESSGSSMGGWHLATRLA